MRTRHFGLFCAGICALFLAAAAAYGQPLQRPERIQADGPYTHASGMVFPDQVGPFMRTTVNRYNAETTNVSASYGRQGANQRFVITVYVYPFPMPQPDPQQSDAVNTVIGAMRQAAMSEQLFSAEKGAIRQPRPDAVEIRSEAADRQIDGRTYKGFVAEYRYNDSLLAGAPLVRSYLYYYPFVSGNWVLKYRITHAEEIDAQTDIEAFLRDLPWTFPPPS